jgi:hypothetical protein
MLIASSPAEKIVDHTQSLGSFGAKHKQWTSGILVQRSTEQGKAGR